jgi:type I restriction enzyme S subunit
MNTGILDKLRFPYPPLKLQQKFVGIFGSIEQDKARLVAHLAQIDTLFASIQQRAFSGEF